MTQHGERPPLGIKPRGLWIEERTLELVIYMDRLARFIECNGSGQHTSSEYLRIIELAREITEIQEGP